MRRWVGRMCRGLWSSGLLGFRGRRRCRFPLALAHPFEYSNGALVRKVPDQCRSDWAVVRSRLGDLATAVESKVDKAIAVALDGLLRMPAALQ